MATSQGDPIQNYSPNPSTCDWFLASLTNESKGVRSTEMEESKLSRVRPIQPPFFDGYYAPISFVSLDRWRLMFLSMQLYVSPFWFANSILAIISCSLTKNSLGREECVNAAWCTMEPIRTAQLLLSTLKEWVNSIEKWKLSPYRIKHASMVTEFILI